MADTYQIQLIPHLTQLLTWDMVIVKFKTFIPIRLDVGIGRELMVHVNVAQMF